MSEEKKVSGLRYVRNLTLTVEQVAALRRLFEAVETSVEAEADRALLKSLLDLNKAEEAGATEAARYEGPNARVYSKAETDAALKGESGAPSMFADEQAAKEHARARREYIAKARARQDAERGFFIACQLPVARTARNHAQATEILFDYIKPGEISALSFYNGIMAALTALGQE